MAYEKQTWANGDVITANKLNHIKDGIGNINGILSVKQSLNSETNKMTLNKTWQEIHNALVCMRKCK